MRGAAVLVTGGAGFLGTCLVKELLDAGANVRILDNFSSNRKGLDQAPSRSVHIVDGDVRNAIACRSACRGIDVVFHLAALTSIPASIVDPVASDATNIGGTLNMLIAARESKVKRFVFASTAAVYGDCLVPADEDAILKPLSPHGVGKLYGEQMCRLYSELYRLNTVSLRISHLYGPGQCSSGDRATFIPIFLNQMMEGTSVSLEGRGLQTRDLLHVRDAARGLILAAINKEAGGALNLASGESITVRTVYDRLRKMIPGKSSSVDVGARAGDVKIMRIDPAWAMKTLGFKASVGLDEGLREMVDERRANSETPEPEPEVRRRSAITAR